MRVFLIGVSDGDRTYISWFLDTFQEQIRFFRQKRIIGDNPSAEFAEVNQIADIRHEIAACISLGWKITH